MLLNPPHLTVKGPTTNCRAQILLLLVTLLDFKVPAPPRNWPLIDFCWKIKPWARVFCLPSSHRVLILWREWPGAPTLYYSSKILVVEMNMQWRCFLIMILKLFNVLLKNQINIREARASLHRMSSGHLRQAVRKSHSLSSPNIVISWPDSIAKVLCSTFSWEPITTTHKVSGINSAWECRCSWSDNYVTPFLICTPWIRLRTVMSNLTTSYSVRCKISRSWHSLTSETASQLVPGCITRQEPQCTAHLK